MQEDGKMKVIGIGSAIELPPDKDEHQLEEEPELH